MSATTAPMAMRPGPSGRTPRERRDRRAPPAPRTAPRSSSRRRGRGAGGGRAGSRAECRCGGDRGGGEGRAEGGEERRREPSFSINAGRAAITSLGGATTKPETQPSAIAAAAAPRGRGPRRRPQSAGAQAAPARRFRQILGEPVIGRSSSACCCAVSGCSRRFASTASRIVWSRPVTVPSATADSGSILAQLRHGVRLHVGVLAVVPSASGPP